MKSRLCRQSRFHLKVCRAPALILAILTIFTLWQCRVKEHPHVAFAPRAIAWLDLLRVYGVPGQPAVGMCGDRTQIRKSRKPFGDRGNKVHSAFAPLAVQLSVRRVGCHTTGSHPRERVASHCCLSTRYFALVHRPEIRRPCFPRCSPYSGSVERRRVNWPQGLC